MNYKESIEYLEKLNVRGINPGLITMTKLLAMMGNPHKGLKYIQVAGTNAKGSVCTFISEILIANGYKCGLYSSPAVFDDRENWSVNSKIISKTEFARLVTEISEQLKDNPDIVPTRFEFETLMAFLFFRNKQCDVAVLEAGMGGTLDATNICPDNEICVFTPIGMDHMGFLGKTLAEIAYNKSGIIKKNSIVISAKQETDVEDVLNEEASKNNKSVKYVDTARLRKIKYKKTETSFDYCEYKDVRIRMLGIKQPENAALAIEVAGALSMKGFALSDEKIKKGLFTAFLKGRFELISVKPAIYLDGGHNEPAALQLRDNLNLYCKNKNIIEIMSMLKDKDVDKVSEIVTPMAGHVLTVTGPNKARALDKIKLAEHVMNYNPVVTACDSPEEAVEISLMLSNSQSVIVVFGSFTHLSKIRKLFAESFLKE